jgi:hypothetical protein
VNHQSTVGVAVLSFNDKLVDDVYGFVIFFTILV